MYDTVRNDFPYFQKNIVQEFRTLQNTVHNSTYGIFSVWKYHINYFAEFLFLR